RPGRAARAQRRDLERAHGALRRSADPRGDRAGRLLPHDQLPVPRPQPPARSLERTLSRASTSKPNTRPQNAEPTPISVMPDAVTASVPAAAKRSFSGPRAAPSALAIEPSSAVPATVISKAGGSAPNNPTSEAPNSAIRPHHSA